MVHRTLLFLLPLLLITICLCNTKARQDSNTRAERQEIVAAPYDSIYMGIDSISYSQLLEKRKRYHSKMAVDGKRTEKEVLSFIHTDSNHAALRYAYNKRLKDKPSLAGWMVFKFKILSSGQVIDCTITESEIDDSLLQQTTCTKITNWKFKEIDEEDTTRVVFPFHFGC